MKSCADDALRLKSQTNTSRWRCEQEGLVESCGWLMLREGANLWVVAGWQSCWSWPTAGLVAGETQMVDNRECWYTS